MAKDDPAYKERLKHLVSRAQDKTFIDTSVTLRDAIVVKILADVNINSLAQQGLQALERDGELATEGQSNHPDGEPPQSDKPLL